jgi:hypothetical protein
MASTVDDKVTATIFKDGFSECPSWPTDTRDAPMAETKKTKGSWSPLAVEHQLDQINASKNISFRSSRRTKLRRSRKSEA